MGERKKIDLDKVLNRTSGVKCPECHCRDLRVGTTRQEGSRVKRWRYCRNCGHGPIITYETAAIPK